MKNFFAAITAVLISTSAFGSIDIGIGISSTTSGRLVPALTSTLLMTDWAVSGSANGVQSGYYYHSIYTFNYYRTWASGELFGGNVTSGFGGGLSYSLRGFKEESNITLAQLATTPVSQVRLMVVLDMPGLDSLQEGRLFGAVPLWELVEFLPRIRACSRCIQVWCRTTWPAPSASAASGRLE